MKTVIDEMTIAMSPKAFASLPTEGGIFNSISGLWKFVDRPSGKVEYGPYEAKRQMMSPKGNIQTLYFTRRYKQPAIVDKDDCIVFMVCPV